MSETPPVTPAATGAPATREQIARAPKALLHDHLDGGLRPATVVELASEIGHELPADGAEALGRWFAESADSGSLERYLETFDHTVAVMQQADALTRVARECVEDLAADNVVYAEVRYAPEQHLTGGLSLDESSVPSSVASTRGWQAPGPVGRHDRGRPAAHRHAPPGTLARDRRALGRWRDRGVAGFDIAGAEAGYPPTRHLDAFEYLQRENSHFTIHAGEAFGLPSIWQAIQWCGADRLGHGVRIIDDIEVRDGAASSAGCRRTSATCASRWRCAPTPTCRPARRPRSPSTRSGC